MIEQSGTLKQAANPLANSGKSGDNTRKPKKGSIKLDSKKHVKDAADGGCCNKGCKC